MYHKLYHFIWFHRSKDFEAMKAGKSGIQPKFQFLFHKNLPPRDFSIMILASEVFTLYQIQMVRTILFLETKCHFGKSQCMYSNLTNLSFTWENDYFWWHLSEILARTISFMLFHLQILVNLEFQRV